MNLSHFPTVIVVVGYLMYWIELFILSTGSFRTTFAAWWVAAGILISVCYARRKEIFSSCTILKNSILCTSISDRIFIAISAVLIFTIGLIGLYASYFPPHLVQEYDSLNYHLTLPRQHLLLGSFDHIPWSSADLFLIPLDYALATYCLSTALPNKFVFFIFYIGLTMIASKNIWRQSQSPLRIFIFLSAFWGSHIFGIQLGLAMFDIAMCYLFFAALDSLWNKDYALAITEFGLFFWSKAFIPIQTGVILIVLLTIFFVCRRMKGIRTDWIGGVRNFPVEGEFNLKENLPIFFIVSVVVGGPFIIKSLEYAGTPLYPFAPGILNYGQIDVYSDYLRNIEENSRALLGTKDIFGSGKGVIDFIKHLWLIAVPEKGVNNRFDYPVGLPYLLFLAPFLFSFTKSLMKRTVPIVPVMIILFWATWWFGSQQSRFLIIPIFLMLFCGSLQINQPGRVLKLCILLALVLTSVSVFRAHKADFGKSRYDVLTKRDKALLNMKPQGDRNMLILNFQDALYSQYPFDIKGAKNVFIIERQVL